MFAAQLHPGIFGACFVSECVAKLPGSGPPQKSSIFEGRSIPKPRFQSEASGPLHCTAPALRRSATEPRRLNPQQPWKGNSGLNADRNCIVRQSTACQDSRDACLRQENRLNSCQYRYQTLSLASRSSGRLLGPGPSPTATGPFTASLLISKMRSATSGNLGILQYSPSQWNVAPAEEAHER